MPKLTINDWTDEHRAAAQAEGWDIFHTVGLSDEYRVERLDCPADFGVDIDPLESDVEAWRIIGAGIDSGSPLHILAADIIAVLNPAEHSLIMFERG